MSPRVHKRQVVVQLKIKRDYNKEAYNTVVYSVVTLYKPKSFVPRHSHTLIASGVTAVATNNQIFSNSRKAKYK